MGVRGDLRGSALEGSDVAAKTTPEGGAGRLGWPWVFGLLAVVALSIAALIFGVEAWAGLYPDSPTLLRATDWPVVGDWLATVRERHHGLPARRTPLAARRPVSGPTPQVAPPALRGPVDLPPGVWPELWLMPGDRLREGPSLASDVVAEATAIANVPVLEARGRWRRVRWHGAEGWVRERASGPPPLGNAVEPPRPLPGRPPLPELLAAAKAVLEEAGVSQGQPARHLGPYLLLTDVEEPALLAQLDRAAATLEESYRARYGLEPVGAPAEAVVLFRARASYEEYVRRTGGPRSDAGHVAGGLVALYRQGRLMEDIRTTLLHELTHLLGKRALGPALPSWLDEGMADDLAHSRVGEGGRLVPGSLSETTLRSGSFFETHGGAASWELLRNQLATAGLIPLAELTALDDETFRSVTPQGLAYAESSFFIRYLLAGELASPFRAFLREVAAGEPATPEALLAALGASWQALDEGLAEWITHRAETASPWASEPTPAPPL